jgi:hypothetical protein
LIIPQIQLLLELLVKWRRVGKATPGAGKPLENPDFTQSRNTFLDKAAKLGIKLPKPHA